jgi:hypothetical protein
MKPREKCSGRGCESPQVHHKEINMIGYVLFLVFWLVFGVFYITRDKTRDIEKLKQCQLW